MAAADTNVLVRLVVRDDEIQTARAEAFIARGVWISQLALAETIWVLRSIYGFGHAELIDVVQMFLDLRTAIVEDVDVVAAALDQYRQRPALRFTDCLIVEMARHAGHLPLGTFDRALASLDGTTPL